MTLPCTCIENEEGIKISFCRDCAADLPQRIEDDRGNLLCNPDWMQARSGWCTGSKVADVIRTIYKKNSTEAGPDRAWSAKRGNYADQIIAERLTGRPQIGREIYSLRERINQEPAARAAYSFYHDQSVKEAGFIHHLFIDHFGMSPDGLCGDDGLIEVKVLDAANHILLWEGNESIIEEHKPQVLSGLSCTNRNWADLVFYCPQMLDEKKRLYVRTFWRDEDEISRLECSVKQFLSEVETRLERIRNGNGHQRLEAALSASVAQIKKRKK